MPISTMVSNDRSRFRLFFRDCDRDICLHVDALPKLKSMLRGHTGIRALRGQDSIVSDRPGGERWRRGIASGAQVSRHALRWDGAWLNVDRRLLFGGGFDPAVVERPKIVIRQTADRLIAAYDGDGLYHLNNVHSFSPHAVSRVAEATDLFYLSGLINSSFWLYLYQSTSREAGRALAQIDIEMVETMPLPEGDAWMSAIVSRLSALARQLHGETGHSDKKRADLLSLVERSIDRLVYDLYGLTEAQVSRVENACGGKLAFPGKLPRREEALRLAEGPETAGATFGQ